MKIDTKFNLLLKRLLKIFIYCVGALTAFILGILVFNFIIMPNYVRLGEEVQVPDMTGMNYDDAITVAKTADLNLFVSKYDYDMVTPKGQIISQNPIPGQHVKKDSKIRLTVSKGPEKIFSPDLSNIPLSQAKMNLKSMNLDIGNIEYIYHDNYANDIVIRNFPAPNTPINRNTLISLVVSRGSKPQSIFVPNFIGRSLSEVREMVEDKSIFIGNIVYQENEEYLPETVINQSIAAGKEIFWGDTVNLIISR